MNPKAERYGRVNKAEGHFRQRQIASRKRKSHCGLQRLSLSRVPRPRKDLARRESTDRTGGRHRLVPHGHRFRKAGLPLATLSDNAFWGKHLLSFRFQFQQPRPSSEPPTMRDPMTILLADDSDDDVLLIQLAFKAAQIPPSTQLQVVRSGEEAIAYVKGEGKYADRADHPQPSLLLLDLIMPGTDGFDVLRSLRSEPKLRRLKVIVLTTSADPAKASEAYRLGANAFLVKPGSFEGMID